MKPDKPNDDTTDPPARAPFFRRRGVIVLVSAAVGLAAGMIIRNQFDAVLPARTTSPTPAPSPAHLPLQIWLVTGNQIEQLPLGRIGLPSGSSFQLRIQSASPGTLSVYTVDKVGKRAAAPIWRAEILAGKTVDSPPLSLTGAPGSELLTVVFADKEGTAQRIQQVALWQY